MKDRILNICMLATVAAALILSLIKGTPEEEPSCLAAAWKDVPTPVPTASPSPSEAYRLHRQETREKDRISLQALAENGQAATDVRAAAARELLENTRNDEIELAVEAALAAKGWRDALCAVRNGAATVFLPQAISKQEAAFLLDWIQESSGLDAQHIRMTGF